MRCWQCKLVAGRACPSVMGVVIPAQKIIETLEQQELKDMRARVKDMRERVVSQFECNSLTD